MYKPQRGTEQEIKMKKILALTLLAGISLSSAMSARAADKTVMLRIAPAFHVENTREQLAGSVKFFFGKQEAPRVLQKLGTDNNARKSNAFGKSDEVSCNTAFLSSMIGLEKRAKELGANAVINIVSNYNHVEMSSETEYECHVGAIMSGVAFKGDFVKIADK
jgi:uncharacterized protein YbjQ (UPF0145 family)